MYCPVCGAESTQGLNYCKRCGAGLSASTSPIEQKTSFGKAMGLMLFLVSVVSIAGFIALFATVDTLGEHGFDTRALIGIMAFGGATVVGVVGMMVWLILRMTGAHTAATRNEIVPGLVVREHIAPQLQAPPISVPSVTENTTRNFEPSRFRDRAEHE
jgi:hypothetical protein